MKPFIFSLAIAVGVLFNAQADTGKPDPAKEAAMAEMMKLGQPGEAHQKLEPFVGKWEQKVTWWMAPGDKPQVMKGISENKIILGGRFLQQMSQGEAQKDMPQFEGMGLTGYDNIKQEYTSIWVDNMGTGMMQATSSFDPKAKAFNEKGTFACPMTKEKDRAFRAKWTLQGKDAYKYEMFMNDPKSGKEFKSMEIAYKRAK